MNGKIVGGFIVVSAALAGAAIWYLQVYGFYDRVELAAGAPQVELTSLASGVPEEIVADGFEAIDATSSPIRYRACFTTPLSLAMMSETYEPYPEAVPLVAPGWFGCFDAEEVGVALEEGRALAFMGRENIHYGIDRVVAVMEDGRGFVWQQINPCGEEVFDGRPAPAGCPDPETFKVDTPQESESDG